MGCFMNCFIDEADGILPSIASCEALFEAPQEAMSKGPFILPIDLVCMCSYKVVQVSIFSTKHKQDPIGRHHMCVMCVGI